MVKGKPISGNVALAAMLGAIVLLALIVHRFENSTGSLQLQRQGAGSNAYPRRATDQDGKELTLSRPTERVASQYWSIDETLYSIVPPEHVVGVSQYAYDRNTSNVVSFAETYLPVITADAEAVFKITPDLLLVSSSARADLTDLVRKAGIPTFRMFTDYRTLDEIAVNMTLTGYLTGQDATARREHDKFKRAIERAAKRKPTGEPGPRVLGYSGKYSYGSGTSFHDVLRLLGATNVAAEHGLTGYDAINTEQILRWNPEWILSRAGRGDTESMRRRLLSDPAIAATTAAQKKQVLILENHVFLPMSPFTANLLDVLGEAFYGPSKKN